MNNKFYSNFDLARLTTSSRKDYRTPFQIDRDRIIHSSEFRRLQGKTQVFLSGESDYYRTRLTHSIEVAQIGRSISNYLIHIQNSPFNSEFHIDADLVESACLSHDLGHPPFGHAGERTLNSLMKKYGGFEGNAQTLRLITEIFYRDHHDRRGMNPTRAFLDSILKYKAIFSQFKNPYNHFLYDYQLTYVDFVIKGKDSSKFINSPEEFNNFKSIECQIMDWADDTAYAINDIVDSISGGFITVSTLDAWVEINRNRLSKDELKIISKLKEWINDKNFKAKFGSQIGDFILACNVQKSDSFLDEYTNRYKYRLVIDEAIMLKAKLYKKIAVDLVFTSPPLHQMEFKADEMITRLFKLYENNYILGKTNLKLLPDFTHNLIKNVQDENQKARLICDYISGMTDAYAMRIYKRLFDPNFSSLINFS